MPFHVETQRGAGTWWGCAVASYALAWQLLAAAAVLTALLFLLVPGLVGGRLIGFLVLPAGVAALVGAVCSWSDFVKDVPFR